MFAGVYEKCQALVSSQQTAFGPCYFLNITWLRLDTAVAFFSIKPIRKLHESRIFDGTVSEEENNPPSSFVLKSEATAYSRGNFLFPSTALPSTKDT